MSAGLTCDEGVPHLEKGVPHPSSGLSFLGSVLCRQRKDFNLLTLRENAIGGRLLLPSVPFLQPQSQGHGNNCAPARIRNLFVRQLVDAFYEIIAEGHGNSGELVLPVLK